MEKMQGERGHIHPQAVVAEGAHVPASCSIGPFCVVGPHVSLGEGYEEGRTEEKAGQDDVNPRCHVPRR